MNGEISSNDIMAYHITWATHNSRVSEKMIKVHVKKGEPVILSNNDRKIVYDSLLRKTTEEKISVFALNVLNDHVHILINCREDALNEIIRKLKGYSSYFLSRELNYSAAGSGRVNKLWAKSFSATFIRSERHLNEAIEYILTNHIKHGLPPCNTSCNRVAGS